MIKGSTKGKFPQPPSHPLSNKIKDTKSVTDHPIHSDIVGEIFICGKETDGALQVLPQYLGKAITGLGGGTDQLYVIEEDEGFLGGVNAVMPHLGNLNERAFRNNTHDGNRPSGRKHQALVHQKFGMTPFD